MNAAHPATPSPNRPAMQADPKIVKKTRRDNANYTFFGGLPGEPDYDLLLQPSCGPQASRPREFGRPGLG